VTKARKALLGVVTAWQLVYAALFTGTLVRVLLSGFAPLPGGEAGLPEGFGPSFFGHLATLLLMLGLAVYYVGQAARSPRVPARERKLWVVLNVVGGFLAQLVFWYLFIWREPEPLATTPAGPDPRS
jgi:hypothetical protein